MSKIKKYDEYVSHYAYVTYFKDEGMFKVKASINVHIEETAASSGKKEIGFAHEVTDVDLEFFLNDKKCKHVGFMNMYEELFGINTFDTYYGKLQDEFEEHYMKNPVKVRK